MTNPNYTHLLVVADRSGSMQNIAQDMIGGLDAFFAEQAEQPGVCLVDYAQFDTHYDLVFEDRHVSKAKAVIEPRGGTALLDAIGRSVTELGRKLAHKPEAERPGKVIVVVVTDGAENSSREWKPKYVKELIKKQESEYNWDFVFLGANMDAVSVGRDFGFNPDKALTYDVHNIGAMSLSLSGYTTRSRLATDKSDAVFTSADRDAQKA